MTATGEHAARNDRRVCVAAAHSPLTLAASSKLTPGVDDSHDPAHRSDLHGHAATYIDRIRKGAKPSGLAVQRPTTFTLVFNLRAAGARGLTIPPSVLLRADEVIE